MSFVLRKSEPLGIELKSACDGYSGMMLSLEIKGNKVRGHPCLDNNMYDLHLVVYEMMARKKYREFRKVQRLFVRQGW